MAQLRRYELTDAERAIIDPLLPRKSRGVARVEDRRVLNGIFWRLRSGAPWADIPERYGPYTTCHNRFVRWRKAGIWDKLLQSVSDACAGQIQMIDSSVFPEALWRLYLRHFGAFTPPPIRDCDAAVKAACSGFDRVCA